MANAAPEHKRSSPWPWVVGIIIAILVVIGLFAFFTDDPDPVVPDENDMVVGEVDEFSAWVEQEMPEYEDDEAHLMAANGFARLAEALDGVRHEAVRRDQPAADPADPDDPAAPDVTDPDPAQNGNQQQEGPGQLDPPETFDEGDFEAYLETMRESSDNLRDEEDSLRHGDYANAGAVAASQMMEQLEEYYPAVVNLLPEVRSSAQALDPDATIREQREQVEDFFTQAETALRAMVPGPGVEGEPAELPVDPDPGNDVDPDMDNGDTNADAPPAAPPEN